jgi:DNA replication protein
MILKRLYEEYDLPIERLLMKESKRLGLSTNEVHVLLALFSIYKKRRTFSIAAIQRRIDLSAEMIGNAIDHLIDLGFLSMALESKEGKQREVFHLDFTFDKIESLFKEDEKNELKVVYETKISETIRLFEQGLGRNLYAYELENIRKWYDESLYQHQAILKAIENANQRISIKHVEKLLNQGVVEKVVLDEEVEQVLDEIYQKIK